MNPPVTTTGKGVRVALYSIITAGNLLIAATEPFTWRTWVGIAVQVGITIRSYIDTSNGDRPIDPPEDPTSPVQGRVWPTEKITPDPPKPLPTVEEIAAARQAMAEAQAVLNRVI